MMTEKSQDALVREGLQALGVALVCEWDCLFFLYNHSASLGTVAEMARLIGYDKAETGVALRGLEALGLIHRSRISQGIRIYRFSEPSDPGRRAGLLALIDLARNRAGRLLLLKHLKSSSQEPRRKRRSGLRLA
jgi:DNA-binding MarR family transcriptional regulator